MSKRQEGVSLGLLSPAPHSPFPIPSIVARRQGGREGWACRTRLQEAGWAGAGLIATASQPPCLLPCPTLPGPCEAAPASLSPRAPQGLPIPPGRSQFLGLACAALLSTFTPYRPPLHNLLVPRNAFLSPSRAASGHPIPCHLSIPLLFSMC